MMRGRRLCSESGNVLLEGLHRSEKTKEATTMKKLFVPIYGYIACAWAGFAGYGTAMLLSYFVGQKKYPINYPVKEIMIYVVLALILFAGMTEANRYFSSRIACLINTVLILIFAAYLVKKDFPLKSLPVVGKYFRK